MAAFSVGVNVEAWTLNKDGACVEAGTLAEISVTDRPANPECLITHRHPPSANAAFYDIAQQWVATFKKLAEAIAHQAVKTQRRTPPAVRLPPLAHRPLPRRTPPTQFAQLVQQMQD